MSGFAEKLAVIEKLLTKIVEIEVEVEKNFSNSVAMEIGLRLDEIYDILLREKAEILKNWWRMQKINKINKKGGD
jgi:hypothetical protein